MVEKILDLNPQGRPVAIIEILLLLFLAATIGWIIARFLFHNRIHTLRAQIIEKDSELEECRRAKVQSSLKKADSNHMAESINPYKPSPAGKISVSSSREPSEQADTIHISATSEAAVLARIASRAPELNFDRIGRASPAQADDLKDIVGIGPLLERKLHTLGIYTYRQISNFTREDMIKVNEIIEFFPGRIERDNWVGQARIIHERKYGTKL